MSLFLDLPTEIRLKIFAHQAPDSRALLFQRTQKGGTERNVLRFRRSADHTNILLLCKKISQEANSVVYSFTTLYLRRYVPSDPSSTLSAAFLKALRSVSLSVTQMWFHPDHLELHDLKSFLKTVDYYPALQELRIRYQDPWTHHSRQSPLHRFDGNLETTARLYADMIRGHFRDMVLASCTLPVDRHFEFIAEIYAATEPANSLFTRTYKVWTRSKQEMDTTVAASG